MTDPTADEVVALKAGELLPCPFCGKPPKTCPDTSYGAATVFCPDEHECPMGPVAVADLNAGETLETAIARWNTRPPAADAEEVREREKLLARVDSYIERYEDAPNWGGPTIYPLPLRIDDIKALRKLATPAAAATISVSSTKWLRSLPDPAQTAGEG